MRRVLLLVLALILSLAVLASLPVRAATFPINYSDPSSDVVRLNATTGLCVVDTSNNCIMSPDPHDVNIQWLRGRETGPGNSNYNLTIQVVGRIRNLANTSYMVNLYTDATNRTHWIVNYTNGFLLLYMNQTGATRINITGNATIWGVNPTTPNSVSMFVNKTLLGGPSNISASVNIDSTAIMRGDPRLGQNYSFQDFGWEVPGHPTTSPTLLNGHVYVKSTTTPIVGATVALSTGQSVITNATGFYQVSLTPGTFNVTVSGAGYVSATFSVTLATGQTMTKDVELEQTGGAVLASWLVPILLITAVAAVGLVIFAWSRRKKREEKS